MFLKLGMMLIFPRDSLTFHSYFGFLRIFIAVPIPSTIFLSWWPTTEVLGTSLLLSLDHPNVAYSILHKPSPSNQIPCSLSSSNTENQSVFILSSLPELVLVLSLSFPKDWFHLLFCASHDWDGLYPGTAHSFFSTGQSKKASRLTSPSQCQCLY